MTLTPAPCYPNLPRSWQATEYHLGQLDAQLAKLRTELPFNTPPLLHIPHLAGHGVPPGAAQGQACQAAHGASGAVYKGRRWRGVRRPKVWRWTCGAHWCAAAFCSL
eukprot:358404-Chlamydomonas_euryale.AAC.19